MRSGNHLAVDVSIERGPLSTDFPGNWSAIWPLRQYPVDRGRVRLVVDLPVHPAQGISMAISSALTLLVLAGAVWFVSESSAAAGAILWWGAPAVIILGAFFIWRARAWREQLVIDAKLVTVRLGGTEQYQVPRDKFVDVRLAPEWHGRSRLHAPFRRHFWPTIVWGEAGPDPYRVFAWGVGQGINLETASQLIERIREFCEEVPPATP
ncbi:MAG: hypothetical protein Q8M66_02880 [Actinomycetota bacterium]|nr:hypothetical protein [Actinomycetota bacterium]MDZ4178726.1 hypothetical protein [Coriobacteriia bacterium]